MASRHGVSLANYARSLETHYTQRWHAPIERLRLASGPIHELPETFEVLVIPRSTDTTAYATLCMSTPEDSECLELHILARPSDRTRHEIVEALTAVAHFHRTGDRLGLGHSINLGRPWQPGSECTHGVISLPYLDGPDLEWLDIPAVRFLWLIPVTEAEVRYKKQHGMEAPEERFEDRQFDYLDPMRKSVV